MSARHLRGLEAAESGLQWDELRSQAVLWRHWIGRWAAIVAVTMQTHRAAALHVSPPTSTIVRVHRNWTSDRKQDAVRPWERCVAGRAGSSSAPKAAATAARDSPTQLQARLRAPCDRCGPNHGASSCDCGKSYSNLSHLGSAMKDVLASAARLPVADDQSNIDIIHGCRLLVLNRRLAGANKR